MERGRMRRGRGEPKFVAGRAAGRDARDVRYGDGLIIAPLVLARTVLAETCPDVCRDGTAPSCSARRCGRRADMPVNGDSDPVPGGYRSTNRRLPHFPNCTRRSYLITLLPMVVGRTLFPFVEQVDPRWP